VKADDTTTGHRENPYPGLRPFRADETHLFFGRDQQRSELLGRLRRSRFLAVVGTSGSGKSSLVRAGLLPGLYGGFMAQSGGQWRIADMRPGSDPIGNLARALDKKGVLRDSDLEEGQLSFTEALLRRSALGLCEAVRRAELPEDAKLLVLVDQFEELFRAIETVDTAEMSDDASAFVKLLLEASRQTELPIYIVLTMRSDFLGNCARFRDLPKAINEGQYLIPRMTRDERREAIEGPAAVYGVSLSPTLVNRLLNDVGDNPDHLPILQHALMRTWDCWKVKHPNADVIDLSDYEDEEVGGMWRALSLHADSVLAGLSDGQNKEESDKRQHIAECLFKCLTEKTPGGQSVRRLAKLQEIADVAGVTTDEVILVIDAFRQPSNSFLMPPIGEELTPDTYLDISHESLIRNWEILKDWATTEAKSAESYRWLVKAAERWRDGLGELFRGTDLVQAVDWKKQRQPTPEWAARYGGDFRLAIQFLDASETESERQAQQARSLRRRNFRRLSFFAIAMTALSVVAGVKWRQANSYAEEAERNAKDATRLRFQLVLASARGATGNYPDTQLLTAAQAAATSSAQPGVANIAHVVEVLREAIELPAASLQGHDEKIAGMMLSPGGNLLTAGRDSIVRTWRLAEHEAGLRIEPWGIRHLRGPVGTIAFDPDSDLIAASEGWDVTVRALSGGAQNARRTARKPDIELTIEKQDLLGSLRFLDQEKQVLVSSEGTDTLRLSDTEHVITVTARIGKGGTIALGNAGALREIVTKLPDGEVAWKLNEHHQVELTGGEVRRRLAATPSEDLLLKFGPNGNRLVFAEIGGEVRIWDFSKNARPSILTGSAGRVTGIATSSDGRWLVVGDEEGTTRFWDWQKLDEGPVGLVKGEHGVTTLTFSPDSSWLALGTDQGSLQVLEVVDSVGELRDLSNAQPRIVWEHRQRIPSHLFSAGRQGVTFSARRQELTMIAFSSNGDWLATTAEDGTIYVGEWKKDANDVEVARKRLDPSYQRLKGDEVPISFMSFTGKPLRLTTGSADGIIRVWNVETATDPLVTLLQGHGGTVYSVAFDQATELLATGSWGGTVRFWRDGIETHPVPKINTRGDGANNNKRGGINVALSSDGRWLATGDATGAVRLWDLKDESADPELLYEHEGAIYSIVFSPDARWLATAGTDEKPRVWNMRANREGPHLPLQDGVISALAFSWDSRRFATGNWKGEVKLWRVYESSFDEEEVSWPDHIGRVHALAFSPDGDEIATAAERVRLQSLQHPSAPPLTLEARHIRALAYAPSGRLLAGASEDRIHLWDPRQPGSEPAVLEAHTDWVHALSFNKDGTRLAAGSRDTTVSLWRIDPSDLAGVACARVGRNLMWEEWSRHFTGQEYENTCETHAHPSVREEAQKLARSGFRDKSRALFTRLRDLGEEIDGKAIDPESELVRAEVSGIEKDVKRDIDRDRLKEARRKLQTAQKSLQGNEKKLERTFKAEAQKLEAQELIVKARKLARDYLELDNAFLILQDAEKLDETLELHEERTKLGKYAISKLAATNRAFASQERVERACEVYELASNNGVVVTAVQWNQLCWRGVLAASPALVRHACEKAVELAPTDGGKRDSHGVALAQLDHLPEAKAEFQHYVKWASARRLPKHQIERRKNWLRRIEQGHNPINEQTLRELRCERPSPNNESSCFRLTDEVSDAVPSASQESLKTIAELYDSAWRDGVVVKAPRWNALCWKGALAELPALVRDACDKAVQLAPTDAVYRDNRGVVLAQLDELGEAQADFEYFVKWAPSNGVSEEMLEQRREWVRIIKENDRNPIDAKTLKEPRGGI